MDDGRKQAKAVLVSLKAQAQKRLTKCDLWSEEEKKHFARFYPNALERFRTLGYDGTQIRSAFSDAIGSKVDPMRKDARALQQYALTEMQRLSSYPPRQRYRELLPWKIGHVSMKIVLQELKKKSVWGQQLNYVVPELTEEEEGARRRIITQVCANAEGIGLSKWEDPDTDIGDVVIMAIEGLQQATLFVAESVDYIRRWFKHELDKSPSSSFFDNIGCHGTLIRTKVDRAVVNEMIACTPYEAGSSSIGAVIVMRTDDRTKFTRSATPLSSHTWDLADD